MSNSKLYQLLLAAAILAFVIIPGSIARTAPEAVNFTNPGSSDVLLAEMDEFATDVLFDPWDMSQPTDLTYYRGESQLTNTTFANGIYSAQMTSGNGGERITLLDVGATNNAALRTGKMGYNFPINTNTYRYLTLRLYKGHAGASSGLILWYEDDSFATAKTGISNGYGVPGGTGWHTIVVDLETIGIQSGGKNWSGTVRGLIIKPYAGPGSAGSTVKLDWARLTKEDPRSERPFTIQWTGGSGTFDLYASPDNKSLGPNDYLIAADVSASDGSYTFQTGVLPAGKYYIGADEGSSVSWSSGAMVVNAKPIVEITKPSRTSGEEYGRDINNNAWDMSNTTDVNHALKPWETTCLSGQQFASGIFSANLVANCPSTHVDPIVYFGHMDPFQNVQDPLVDTSKFRYFSYRFFHSGEQNVTEGWVSRFGWWQTNNEDNVTTQEVVLSRDIIIHEGWNEYNIDLWAPDIVDEAHPVQRAWSSSAPNRLRFDPTELNSNLLPASIQLDWFKLTAMDEVVAGAPFNIEFDPSESSASFTFYYDTDTNPNNGRTLIGSSPRPVNGLEALASGSFTIFLPALSNNYSPCTTAFCYGWQTSGVSAGQYFVCIEADDGTNTSYRCSESPVVVQ